MSLGSWEERGDFEVGFAERVLVLNGWVGENVSREVREVRSKRRILGNPWTPCMPTNYFLISSF